MSCTFSVFGSFALVLVGAWGEAIWKGLKLLLKLHTCGVGCSSVVEHLLSMPTKLDSLPSLLENDRKKISLIFRNLDFCEHFLTPLL